MVMKKFTEVMEISGVPVYAHWSLLLIGALILIGAIERPAETIAAWASFFGVILIHECGHMVVAQRKGYQVLSIKLYPILGFVLVSALSGFEVGPVQSSMGIRT